MSVADVERAWILALPFIVVFFLVYDLAQKAVRKRFTTREPQQPKSFVPPTHSQSALTKRSPALDSRLRLARTFPNYSRRDARMKTGRVMARYLARDCPKCGGYMGIVIPQSQGRAVTQEINGFCPQCGYRLAWISIRGKAISRNSDLLRNQSR